MRDRPTRRESTADNEAAARDRTARATPPSIGSPALFVLEIQKRTIISYQVPTLSVSYSSGSVPRPSSE